ncbi:hypothetical protein PBT90_08675 [Algoriphagus halophytocola]|uniref:Uncharacterized protein n=1 Tax=Algoriphagus halophytocola TaxID=2991499 RepID=A0ABY6MI59_9BACT|nr:MULTISPECIES: hypothetical protein [unclassified Algoriphagus]UZD23460.1 hypothetical protein OM944_02995 [Algoriphagus sp. TR-M5]WBL44755.1 hypothetical protein PBT90_08675 [Algoriphagus sp. TR-M9]
MQSEENKISRDDNVQVNSYSELMSNYFPESSIKGSKEIRTLMIGPDQPLVFYQDKEDKLHALLRKEGSESGWVNISLSKGAVKSYEFEYNRTEESFQIAKVEDNQVWVSQSLPIGSTDFDKLSELLSWTGVTPGSYKEQVDKVSIGTKHLLFATSEAGKDALYYLADLEELNPKAYTLPEHAKVIYHFELGNFLYSNGVFFLYQIGKEKGMLYQSFPDPKYNKVDQYRFEPGESINSFALLESEDGNDIVYAAGNQVHEIKAAEDGSTFAIQTLPGTLDKITKIRAASYQNEHSVWALDSRGLHYQTNRFFDQNSQSFEVGKWTAPLLMVDGAEQFSCAKGKGARNQLFAVNTSHGSELTRLWQDEVTTMWNSHQVTLSDMDSLKEVESYSAQIRFNADTSLKSFAGQKVMLSADSNLFVYINSQSYHLGPDHQVAIPLGLVPEFTIICPVKGLGSSVVRINADFLQEEKLVSLSGKVLERMNERVNASKGLDKVKKANGQSLVPAGVDPSAVKGAQEGISQMLSVAKDMGAKKPVSLANTAFTVGATASATTLTSGVSLHSLADAGHTLGDFLHSIWDKAKEAFEFVMEKVANGVKFIIKIGEQVFNWIVKTIHEIGSFIEKVFEAIKVFFKDLFEFLAFLFDWDSILATKKAYKGFVNNSLEGLKSEIGTIRKFIDETLEREIEKFSPELVNIPDQMNKVDVTDSPKESQADPRANWLNSKKDYLDKGKEGEVKKKMPTEFSNVFESLINDLKPILEKTGVGLLSQIELVGKEFTKVIHGKTTFGDFLKFALQKLAGTGLFLLKQLIDVIMRALEALVEVAYVGLNKEWQIPILSQLYKQISGGDALTFLDVMCLFVAIPSTILYKIAEGKAPFESSETRDAFVKSGERVFQLNLN